MSDVAPTAAERASASLEKRTGPCINKACTFECEAYAHAGNKDGYRVCVCTHTQWSHAVSVA